MSDRIQMVLRYLANNEYTSEEKITTALNLTERQLTYTIDNINQDLILKQLPTIERLQKKIVYERSAIEEFLLDQTDNQVLFSKEDRPLVIICLILNRQTEMSINHFMDHLNVSKNTILNDLKASKRILENYQLGIQFSRKHGYHITGSEWNKRNLLNFVLNHIYKTYGITISRRILAVDDIFEDSVEHLQQVEKMINKHYTDENFYTLALTLSVVFNRIDKGRLIEKIELLHMNELKETPEYQALELVYANRVDLTEIEKMYLVLFLLSANTLNKGAFPIEELSSLSESLWEFLSAFEAQTFLTLDNKKMLLEKLLNHFKPAYYRIKYNVPSENSAYQQIITEYSVLHDFVRQSADPIHAYFGKEVSDEEIAYLTLFIGGHLIQTDGNDQDDKVIKAVVLCPNGISMSKLLEQSLREVFPEFVFYPSVSIREYEKFLLPHDLVFSTVPISTSKKTYIISNLLSKGHLLTLRQKVISELYHLDLSRLNIYDVLDIVKKHATIQNEKGLYNDLVNLLLEPVPSQIEDHVSDEYQLVDFLQAEFITFVDQRKSWEELLHLATKKLLVKEIVDQDFETKLWSLYKEKPEYIMLRNQIVLPHLSSDVSAQKIGLSIVVSKPGFKYQGQLLHVVMLLTTPDKTTHLPMLKQINQLAKNQDAMEAITDSEDAEEIRNIVRNFFRTGA